MNFFEQLIQLPQELMTEQGRRNHTIENCWRDTITYFITPCVRKLIPRPQQGLNLRSQCQNKIIEALKKLTKSKRTKTNLEQIILRQFEIDTRHLQKIQSSDFADCQKMVRKQICLIYQTIQQQLWSHYKQTKKCESQLEMSQHIYKIMVQKQLEWETGNKRFQHKRTNQNRSSDQAETNFYATTTQATSSYMSQEPENQSDIFESLVSNYGAVQNEIANVYYYGESSQSETQQRILDDSQNRNIFQQQQNSSMNLRDSLDFLRISQELLQKFRLRQLDFQMDD